MALGQKDGIPAKPCFTWLNYSTRKRTFKEFYRAVSARMTNNRSDFGIEVIIRFGDIIKALVLDRD